LAGSARKEDRGRHGGKTKHYQKHKFILERVYIISGALLFASRGSFGNIFIDIMGGAYIQQGIIYMYL
jgi:hypothetical protein